MTMVQDIYKSSGPFEWAIHYLPVVGWPVIVVAAWKLRGIITKATDRTRKAELHITKMSCNEMPHIQRTLINIDKNMAKLAKGEIVDLSDLPMFPNVED
jgi:hypothetical protein